MRRKLPRNFLQSKSQNVPDQAQELAPPSAASDSTCQLFERLILFEFGDVIDGRCGDVQ